MHSKAKNKAENLKKDHAPLYYQPSVFEKDWTTLKRSKHIAHDRERSNRLLRIPRDAEILLCLREVNTDKYYLFLNTNDIIITTMDTIITVFNEEMTLQGNRVVLWDEPYLPNEYLQEKYLHIYED